MTRLAYSRLANNETDEVSTEIRRPSISVWKMFIPAIFLLIFLVVYMDALSYDVFPEPVRELKRAADTPFEIPEVNMRKPEPIEGMKLNVTIREETTTIEPTTGIGSTYETEKTVETTTEEDTKRNPQKVEPTIAPVPRFVKRPEVAHVDCGRVLKGDQEYVKEIAAKRPKIIENANLSMSCDDIKKRILPARNPDTGFPILYARIVNEDYEFIEDQLLTNYAEENTYCFSIDRKASLPFHVQVISLSQCLPNVILAKKEVKIDGAGHNQNEAHLDCMGAARDRKWEYAMLLQNHDVMIKTHGEMTEILKIFGGANDVEITKCPGNRCIQSLDKNLGHLGLCPKYLTGGERQKCMSSTIEWGKGAMQVLLSRAAVDFIFDEIDIHPLMKEMNDMGFGVDEQLYESLQITPEIRLPGGFHPKCRDQGGPQYISRLSMWRGSKKDCRSGYLRHSICIYGIEDLPFLAGAKSVMANKMMPNFDQAISSCISELLFNRTQAGPAINRAYYGNINAVRYHHERNNPNFNISNFKCKL